MTLALNYRTVSPQAGLSLYIVRNDGTEWLKWRPIIKRANYLLLQKKNKKKNTYDAIKISSLSARSTQPARQ